MSSEMEPCPRCALHEASPAPCCEDAAAETAQAEAETLHACCCRHKKRSEEEYKSLIHRLNRIEGQIRGIRGMVEKDVYCADILVQVAAALAVPSTPMELVSRLTEQLVTPGTAFTAFSTRAEQAAQLMPVTLYCSIVSLLAMGRLVRKRVIS